MSGQQLAHLWQITQRNAYLELNGIDEYVSTPTSISALNIIGDLTISGWIKLNAGGKAQTIIIKQGANIPYGLEVTSTNLLRFVQNTGAGLQISDSTATIPIGQWVFVAVARNVSASQVSLYINSNVDIVGYSGTTALTDPTSAVRLGANVGGGVLLDGSISEFKVYSEFQTARVLEDRFRSLVNFQNAVGISVSPLNPMFDTANLQLYLPIREGTGSTVNDFSFNQLSCTATGIVSADWQTTNLPAIRDRFYQDHVTSLNGVSIQRNVNNGQSSLDISITNKNDYLNDPFNLDKILQIEYQNTSGTLYTGINYFNNSDLKSNKRQDLTFMSVVSELSRVKPRTPAGDYVISLGTNSIEYYFKYFIDSFNIQGPLEVLRYTNTSIQATGININKTFHNPEDYLAVFNDLWRFTNDDWIWFIDGDNTFNLKQISSTNDFIFEFGYDCFDGNIEFNRTKISTRVKITNSAGINRAYTNVASQLKNGIFETNISDSALTSVADMDIVGSREVSINSTPNKKYSFKIIDINAGGKYKLEDIKPGSTFAVTNLPTTLNLLVVSTITIRPDLGYAIVEAGDLVDFTSRELKALKRDAYRRDFGTSSPTSYVEV